MRIIIVLVTLLLLANETAPSWGAIVVLRKSAEPVYGTITRQDKSQLTVRTLDDSGKPREQQFDRADIAEIIETVSPTRLRALDPKQPADYRDYAEELAAKQRDGEARDTALRLYTLAFALDRPQLGKSALRGMIALARSPQEERRWRGALFLLDSRMTLSDLPSGKNAAEVKKERTRIEEALRGVQLLRRGQGGTARPVLSRPDIAKVLQGYEAFMTKTDLDNACKETSLSDHRLRRVLLLELALESQRAALGEGAVVEELAAPWSRELQTGGNAPVPVIDLDHLTEFDPRQSIYRDGQWIAP